MYKHILIATDGSELADKGVEQGFALAGPLGAKVTVLTVSEPLSARALKTAFYAGVRDPVSRYDQSIEQEMHERFAPIEQRAKEQGVEILLEHEVDDHPAQAIVRVANLQGCDLIVMSSHGRRGAQRLILGSQTAEVLAHTTIPVLVIR
ncbi:MAG: universal stress protein [Gemmobacter sp.]